MESHSNSQKSTPSKSSNEEEVSPRSLETYREIISTLPKKDGCGLYEVLHLYQGYWSYSYILEGAMFAQDHYKAQPNHIFVCSVPKSGTTWLKALTFAIVTRTQFDNSMSPSLTKSSPHNCVPFIEIEFSRKGVKPEPGSPPLMSTHMPYTCLPKSIIESGCKIVYICREPKDTLVSLWHFASRLQSAKEPSSLVETFEYYCQGISDFGPYWDHVLGYWKASLERPEKVLFLKYEDVMRDTSFYVKRVAEFMGYPFSLEEEKQGKVEEVVELCSFENLSNLEVNKEGKYQSDSIVLKNKIFFRKGKIGDWKNYLTPKMAERLDKKTEQKFGEFGLSFDSS